VAVAVVLVTGAGPELRSFILLHGVNPIPRRSSAHGADDPDLQ
jgi:hypothetical protein